MNILLSDSAKYEKPSQNFIVSNARGEMRITNWGHGYFKKQLKKWLPEFEFNIRYERFMDSSMLQTTEIWVNNAPKWFDLNEIEGRTACISGSLENELPNSNTGKIIKIISTICNGDDPLLITNFKKTTKLYCWGVQIFIIAGNQLANTKKSA